MTSQRQFILYIYFLQGLKIITFRVSRYIIFHCISYHCGLCVCCVRVEQSPRALLEAVNLSPGQMHQKLVPVGAIIAHLVFLRYLG